mmetsp:Transcript_42906/g.130578  ORF Transcript_42906/g.130578 Transcript_42906/m.130578 type:complete len:277 (-) Transcript_42906:343-1173(-)
MRLLSLSLIWLLILLRCHLLLLPSEELVWLFLLPLSAPLPPRGVSLHSGPPQFRLLLLGLDLRRLLLLLQCSLLLLLLLPKSPPSRRVSTLIIPGPLLSLGLFLLVLCCVLFRYAGPLLLLRLGVLLFRVLLPPASPTPRRVFSHSGSPRLRLLLLLGVDFLRLPTLPWCCLLLPLHASLPPWRVLSHSGSPQFRFLLLFSVASLFLRLLVLLRYRLFLLPHASLPSRRISPHFGPPQFRMLLRLLLLRSLCLIRLLVLHLLQESLPPRGFLTLMP